MIFSYSFGSSSHLFDDPNSEYLHPSFFAACFWPEKYNGREVEFCFIGSRRRAAEMQSPAPACKNDGPVGSLTMRGKSNEFLGSLPFDAAIHVNQLLALNAVHFITLTGAPLYRGRSEIRYFSFDSDRPDEFF